jgi:biotin transport system substrate-specific component
MKTLRPIDITLAAMFVALMAIGANLTSYLTLFNVPITMQPFFAILAGILLGSRLGAISMIVYALVGLAGAPVFAKLGQGVGSFIGAGGITGGFIISFIAAAFVAGLIVEKSPVRNLGTYLVASFVGLALIYIIGTTYLYFGFNAWIAGQSFDGGKTVNQAISYNTAWQWMKYFLIKDAIFTVIGAVISPRLYNALKGTSAYQKLHNKAA